MILLIGPLHGGKRDYAWPCWAAGRTNWGVMPAGMYRSGQRDAKPEALPGAFKRVACGSLTKPAAGGAVDEGAREAGGGRAVAVFAGPAG